MAGSDEMLLQEFCRFGRKKNKKEQRVFHGFIFQADLQIVKSYVLIFVFCFVSFVPSF